MALLERVTSFPGAASRGGRVPETLPPETERSGFKCFIQFFILASGLGKTGLSSLKQKWKKRKGFKLQVQGNHLSVPGSRGAACVRKQTASAVLVLSGKGGDVGSEEKVWGKTGISFEKVGFTLHSSFLNCTA